MVLGVTRRCARSCVGSHRTRAANTARSAHSRRGLGLVRRSTANSCRRTSSSTSLVEDVRPISRTSPSMCWKIRYSSRSDTAEIMPGYWRPSITAGQRPGQHSGTPQGVGVGAGGAGVNGPRRAGRDAARAATSASGFGYPGDGNGVIMGSFGTPSPCARGFGRRWSAGAIHWPGRLMCPARLSGTNRHGTFASHGTPTEVAKTIAPSRPRSLRRDAMGAAQHVRCSSPSVSRLARRATVDDGTRPRRGNDAAEVIGGDPRHPVTTAATHGTTAVTHGTVVYQTLNLGCRGHAGLGRADPGHGYSGDGPG
jgi:hypothetical protein